MHPIIKPEGDTCSDCDRELLERGKGAAKLEWCDLGLVQRNDHAEHADTNIFDHSSGEEHSRVLSTCLKSGTEREDDYSNEHAVLLRKFISEISVEECAEPSTEFES